MSATYCISVVIFHKPFKSIIFVQATTRTSKTRSSCIHKQIQKESNHNVKNLFHFYLTIWDPTIFFLLHTTMAGVKNVAGCTPIVRKKQPTERFAPPSRLTCLSHSRGFYTVLIYLKNVRNMSTRENSELRILL